MSVFFGSSNPDDRRWTTRWVGTLPRPSDSPQIEDFQPDGSNPIWKISLEDVMAIVSSPPDEWQIEPITTIFKCGICFDDLLQSVALKIPGCKHVFCGDCLQQYVVMKVRQQQYPVKCPTCIAIDGTIHSDVEQETVEKLHMSVEDRNKLVELQLSIHAVALRCPSCKTSMHVDRQDYAASTALSCPLPHCQFKWCRDCTQEIVPSDINHRCKNKKLDRLMRKKGWRYCPGCRTPIQKESGCNHMTCESPGCSVHFCYRCGDLILDASSGGNISEAVGHHYSHCVQHSSRAFRLVTFVRGLNCIH